MTDKNDHGSVRPYGFRVPRYATNFAFILEVDSTHARHHALCTNISEEGLAAELNFRLAPGTQVTVWFPALGSDVPLRIQASVEYYRDKLHGLNFIYSSSQERMRVQALIQSVRN